MVDELMEAVDLDGGGDIDFEEFMEWWNDDSQVGRRYKR
jgi:Ca2+-binding EF-hand superfamily protein